MSKYNKDFRHEQMVLDLANYADAPDRAMIPGMSPAFQQTVKTLIRSVGPYVKTAFEAADLDTKKWCISVARVLHEFHMCPFGGFRNAIRPGQVLPKPGTFQPGHMDEAFLAIALKRMAVCPMCGKRFFRRRTKHCSPACARASTRKAQRLWAKEARGKKRPKPSPARKIARP